MTTVGNLISALQQANRIANRHAGKLLLLGLAAVALHNWRLWQQDKAFLAQRGQPAPLPPLAQWPDLPLVSVLVAAWNEAAHIERHIDSFLALRYPHKELVLCAGGKDGTYELATRHAGPDVRVLRQVPGEGKQQALRRCLPVSQGQIIYLTDADCLLSDDAFDRIIHPFVQGEVQVVTGCSRPLDTQLDEPLVQYQWLNDVNWSTRLPQSVDGILGRNCALRRDTLVTIGGFDAVVHTGTDYHMSRRLVQAGYEIISAPQSYMATEYPATARNYLRMWRRWNKNLLLHGIGFGAWRDVRNILMAFVIYLTTLGLPIATPLLGKTALVASGLLFGVALGNRTRRVMAGSQLCGTPVTRGVVENLVLITALDMLAVFLAVADSLVPRTRSRW